MRSAFGTFPSDHKRKINHTTLRDATHQRFFFGHPDLSASGHPDLLFGTSLERSKYLLFSNTNRMYIFNGFLKHTASRTYCSYPSSHSTFPYRCHGRQGRDSFVPVLLLPRHILRRHAVFVTVREREVDTSSIDLFDGFRETDQPRNDAQNSKSRRKNPRNFRGEFCDLW